MVEMRVCGSEHGVGLKLLEEERQMVWLKGEALGRMICEMKGRKMRQGWEGE